jgi:hypothetical protein
MKVKTSTLRFLLASNEIWEKYGFLGHCGPGNKKSALLQKTHYLNRNGGNFLKAKPKFLENFKVKMSYGFWGEKLYRF